LELFELKAYKRGTKGKGSARVLRRDGFFPAVLYGPKTDPVSLSVNAVEMEHMLKKSKSSQQLVNLFIGDDEKKARSVMIKELQVDPLSRSFLHADFYEVDMDIKIKVKVPVEVTGMSKGVETGGVLNIVRRDLEVFCLPISIPEAIVIDITDLDVGDSVHVEEIPLEDGVEINSDVNFTVVTVVAPKQEVIEEPEEGEEIEGEEGEEGEEGKEAAEDEAPKADEEKK
jgi:large subunit ribosomal protein L25